MAYCTKCGSTLERVECENCGGSGYMGHNCEGTCCCCAEPEDTAVCDVCNGYGGWVVCRRCNTGKP
jgi:hypothetical protein